MVRPRLAERSCLVSLDAERTIGVGLRSLADYPARKEEGVRVRFVLMVALIVSALALWGAGPAAAYAQEGACPPGDGWQLMELTSLPETGELGPSLDLNGDVCLCVKFLGNHPRAGSFVAVDNRVMKPGEY
jgi:hypothetical protein